MLEILTSGKLVRDPQTRTGKSGNPFTTALLRVPTGGKEGEAVIVNVIAFGEASDRLGRLGSGDAVSIAGSATLSEWADKTTGELKHGLSVTASAILSAYDVQRRRGGAEGSAKGGNGAGEPARASRGGAKNGAYDPPPACGPIRDEPPPPDWDDPVPF
jgi:single-strand DNA-binding protein